MSGTVPAAKLQAYPQRSFKHTRSEASSKRTDCCCRKATNLIVSLQQSVRSALAHGHAPTQKRPVANFKKC